MATTIFLPPSSTVAPTIVPAISASWTTPKSTGWASVRGVTVKTSTAAVNDSHSVALSGKCCFRQHIMPPFDVNQSVTGTVSWALWEASTTFSNTILSAVVIRVIQPDGTTVRGTPLALTSGVFFALGTGVTNFITDVVSGQAISTVSAIAGDYLVIETGVSDSSGADTAGMRFLDDGATNASYAAQDSTTTHNPTIQFSANLTFGAWPSGASNQLMMTGIGV